MLWGGIYIEKPIPGEDAGYYKLVIRTPLDMANVIRTGYTMDAEDVLIEQDALVVLLSAISSTPVTLQKAILDSVYYAPAGQEPISADFEWCNIGDCRIRISAYDFTDDNHIIIFHIAPLEPDV